jgi:hypothetical protein
MFSGRKRIHDFDRMTASIAAQRNRAAFAALRIRADEKVSYRRIGRRKTRLPTGLIRGPRI